MNCFIMAVIALAFTLVGIKPAAWDQESNTLSTTLSFFLVRKQATLPIELKIIDETAKLKKKAYIYECVNIYIYYIYIYIYIYKFM